MSERRFLDIQRPVNRTVSPPREAPVFSTPEQPIIESPVENKEDFREVKNKLFTSGVEEALQRTATRYGDIANLNIPAGSSSKQYLPYHGEENATPEQYHERVRGLADSELTLPQEIMLQHTGRNAVEMTHPEKVVELVRSIIDLTRLHVQEKQSKGQPIDPEDLDLIKPETEARASFTAAFHDAIHIFNDHGKRIPTLGELASTREALAFLLKQDPEQKIFPDIRTLLDTLPKPIKSSEAMEESTVPNPNKPGSFFTNIELKKKEVREFCQALGAKPDLTDAERICLGILSTIPTFRDQGVTQDLLDGHTQLPAEAKLLAVVDLLPVAINTPSYLENSNSNFWEEHRPLFQEFLAYSGYLVSPQFAAYDGVDYQTNPSLPQGLSITLEKLNPESPSYFDPNGTDPLGIKSPINFAKGRKNVFEKEVSLLPPEAQITIRRMTSLESNYDRLTTSQKRGVWKYVSSQENPDLTTTSILDFTITIADNLIQERQKMNPVQLVKDLGIVEYAKKWKTHLEKQQEAE